MPRTRLAGEFGKVRTGAQADIQFCRLPVRLQSRSGLTDTGPLAEPSGQNTRNNVTTGLSGQAVHVSDRFTNSHRKASSPRPTTHETHTVASQKQLESTRVIRKSDSNSQVPTPPFTMVAKRRQCSQRPTITPNKACSPNLYRHIKRRVGHSLKRTHCKRGLVTTRKQTIYKLFGTKSSLSSLERVPNLCTDKIILVATDNTTVVSYINKEGGMRSCPLCALLWRILTWCTRQQVILKARHIPGRLNVVADTLIPTRPDHLNRVVSPSRGLPSYMQQVAPASNRPICHEVQQQVASLVSPVPDPLATAVDSLSLPWKDLDAYAFPPAAILSKVVEKLQDTPCKRIILIYPGWPSMPWFWDLVAMSNPSDPAHLAQSVDTAFQSDPSQKSNKPKSPCMAPRATAIKEQGFSEAVAARIEASQRGSTRSVYEAKWTIFAKWCISNQVDFRHPL